MWSSKKVKFKCPKCSEFFNVQTKYLLQKDKVFCPSCDYEIPEPVLSGIKDSIQAASRAFVYIRDNKLELEFDFIPVEQDN